VQNSIVSTESSESVQGLFFPERRDFRVDRFLESPSQEGAGEFLRRSSFPRATGQESW
jgi:hypothetical protein